MLHYSGLIVWTLTLNGAKMTKWNGFHVLAIANMLEMLHRNARLRRNTLLLHRGQFERTGMMRRAQVCEEGIEIVLKCGTVVLWTLPHAMAIDAIVIYEVRQVRRECRCSHAEAQRVVEVRRHDCKRSNCGPVCTFGEW